MNLVAEAAEQLVERLRGSGCEEGIVKIDSRPDCTLCQYEKGACMIASFGGRSAEFVTFEPVRVTTRVSFLKGSALEKTVQRIAACAVINAVCGFLCLARRLSACDPGHHQACAAMLAGHCRNKRIFCVGEVYHREVLSGLSFVGEPGVADIILVTGEGLVSPEGVELVSAYRGKKSMLLLSPSTAGIASLLGLDHWCPYGGAESACPGGA